MNVRAMRDQTSWLAIGFKASNLNIACADKLRYRYGGGRATVGDDKGIVIRLGMVGSLSGSEIGNETMEQLVAVD